MLQVRGLEGFQAALRQVDKGLAQGLRGASKKAADIVVAEAKRRAPVKSGALRASVRSRTQQRGARVVAGSARVPYAGAINWGWKKRNIAPQEFLYSAIAAKRDDIEKAYLDELDDLADQAGFRRR